MADLRIIYFGFIIYVKGKFVNNYVCMFANFFVFFLSDKGTFKAVDASVKNEVDEITDTAAFSFLG